MAQAPSAGLSAPQRPLVGQSDSIFAQFESFKQRVREGALAPPQINSLRQVLAHRLNEIVTIHARLGKANPLLDIPEELNPALTTGAHAAIIDGAEFAARLQAAAQVYAATAHDPAYAAALVASVKKPPELFSPAEMGKLTRMSLGERETLFKKNPMLKQRYDHSIAHYKRHLEAKGKIGTAGGTSTPGSSSVASPAADPVAGTSSGANAVSLDVDRKPDIGAAGGLPAANAALPPPAQSLGTGASAVPAYVEPPELRFKRKVRDYLRESAPELEMEAGVDAILTEVVDKFLEGVVRDSVRLAVHRKAGRVDVGDVAKVLDDQYGLAVPGFAVVVPKKVHLEPESKRARAVVPRRKRDE
ncbi:hypothetical protein Q5752_000087 [Cryptotrichosporon argae]